jgi:hypothetical protein
MRACDGDVRRAGPQRGIIREVVVESFMQGLFSVTINREQVPLLPP